MGWSELFSDKSDTTLYAEVLQLYPLDVTLINFKNSYRHATIAHGKAVVASIPVLYNRGKSFEIIKSTKSKPKKGNSKLEVLSALHSAIELCLVPLQSIAAKGVELRTRQVFSAHMHFKVASFIADISKAEDLLGVKRGNRTFSPCRTCLLRQPHDPHYNLNTNTYLSFVLVLLPMQTLVQL